MGGGTPIVMGGMSDAEMSAQLERQAIENDRMLAEAARQTAALEDQIAEKDMEMKNLLEQQARAQEIDLAQAQKKLDVELDALDSDKKADDLDLNYAAIQEALSKGLNQPRPE